MIYINILVVAILGILGYFGYQKYQKRLLNNHHNASYYRYNRRNDSMLSNSSSSNRKNVSIHDSRMQSEVRPSRELSSKQGYYSSPNGQFIRNRNSITRTSPISYISPNSVYGFVPKSNILNGRDKQKELTREFTVKISPFPSLSRNMLHKNVSFEHKPSPSTEMGNMSNISMLNGSLQTINETPTHGTSFNRSAKRSIADNDDEFLSKKYKNSLFDTIELDDSEISDDTCMEDNFNNNGNKKAQKRPTQNLDSDNMFNNSKKRIKNNEILSSYSSTSDYLNNKDALNKRKHSPEAPGNYTKVKKRTFIEELELLTSDTSPLYKNIYNTNANIKSSAAISKNSINFQKSIDNELKNTVEEEESVDMNLVGHDTEVLNNADSLEHNKKPLENSLEISSALTSGGEIVEESDIGTIEDDYEDDKRCYPIPTHVYSAKDYQFDKKKTKNLLDRLLAAVEESSQNLSLKIDSNLTVKDTVDCSGSAVNSNSTASTLTSLPKIELNSNSAFGSIANASSAVNPPPPISSPSITTTITLLNNNKSAAESVPKPAIIKSTANSFILPTQSIQSVSPIQAATTISSLTSSSQFPIVSLSSSGVPTTFSSTLPKYESITSTPLKDSGTSSGGIQFNPTSGALTSTPAPSATSNTTAPDYVKSFAFGATDKSAQSTPSIPAVSFTAAALPNVSVAPQSTTASQLNFNTTAAAPNLAFNFASPDNNKKPTETAVSSQSSSQFSFGLNPTSSTSVSSSSVSLATNSNIVSATAAPFNFPALPSSTSTVSSSSGNPIFGVPNSNAANSNIFALSTNNSNNNNNVISSSFGNNPITNSLSSSTSSSANIFSFGTASTAAATASNTLSAVAAQSKPSFDFSKINTTSLAPSSSVNSSQPTFSAPVPSLGNIGQSQPQQQLFAFNTPNNTTFNSTPAVPAVPAINNNNNSSFSFNAVSPQSNQTPSSNMFSFKAPTVGVKMEQPKSESSGFNFNASKISFDFKPKVGSVVGAAAAAPSSNTGFNFSASAGMSTPQQPSAGSNAAFNFGPVANSASNASSTPFTFNSNPVAAPPAFTFGASSQQPSAGLFQFNSK